MDSGGNPELSVTLPGNSVYPVSNVDFYTTRACIVKPLVKDYTDLYHIQLRVPSNVVVENDGELYSGTFTLKGGSARIVYD